MSIAQNLNEKCRIKLHKFPELRKAQIRVVNVKGIIQIIQGADRNLELVLFTSIVLRF